MHHWDIYSFIKRRFFTNATHIWWEDKSKSPALEVSKIILFKPESKTLQQCPWIYQEFINKAIIPYANAQREILSNTNQAALLIFDVFRGQITNEVALHLLQNNTYFVTVPNNMTDLFQPLDLTVNEHCKKFMKSEFAKWYMQQVG